MRTKREEGVGVGMGEGDVSANWSEKTLVGVREAQGRCLEAVSTPGRGDL